MQRCPWLMLALLCMSGTRAAEFHVATDGDDGGTGAADQPFATLERARDAVRELSRRPAEATTVWLHGGAYSVTEPLALDAADSGTADAPVTWRAAPGERARLFGGTPLQRKWFTAVSDQAVLDQVVSVEARARLLQCDLKARGVTDYGELSRHGFYKANAGKTPPPELWVDGERMVRARWPNPDEHHPECLRGVQKTRRGVVGRSEVVSKGPTAEDPDFAERGGAFSYAFDRPALWTRAGDIWLDGVFSWSWAWSYNQIATIDPERKIITLRHGEVYGIEDQYSYDFFFVENLLEEIDLPGEYYLDREDGVLYILPTDAFAREDAAITLSALTEPMVTMRGASHVVLRDLVFDTGRGSAIDVRGGEGVVVDRCEIKGFSGGAVLLRGRNHGARACHIYDIGGTGVSLGGGDLATLAPGGCFVEDSDIHDFAWYNKVYTPAVALAYRSVGNRVSHNRIRHGPHVAIVVYGNDHLVEYNDIGFVVEDFTDMGAVYANLGSSPLERGTVIRRNYFHDIGHEHHLQNAVYPDNGTMGWSIEENIFHRIGGVGAASTGRAVTNNTGAHIATRHNIFVDCTIPYFMSFYCAPNHDGNVEGWEKYFDEHDLAVLPHARKYPELLRFWEEPRQYPDTNTYEGNVVYNPRTPLLQRFAEIELRDGAVVEAGGTLRMAGNWVADADPGFVDAAAGNFALRPDAPVFEQIPSFPAIPFDEIGPRGPVGP
ncbi:MAG TPA: right-handed parallel beta-helix repeat-containing protein, partial [Armatimonadota bacterium]|nr:right-handed parallel beta-helix repeat-containing protein [Armatimonadota bacterium]